MDRAQKAAIGPVPADWSVAPLSAYTTRVTYGFTNPMPTTNDGPFMLTAKDIHDGRIDYESARHTSIEAYSTYLTDKSRPNVNDILLTKDGSIGRVALVDRTEICINQSVALLQPNDQIHPLFLKYLLETPHYQRQMVSDADGTTIKHIYITRVDKMLIAVPSLQEQRAIAGVLGALDDKIELNRRMNRTLEEMAAAIFKAWFVDFEPVKAKAAGARHFPTMPQEVFDALPTEFVDSPFGPIPKGWMVQKLENVATANYGKNLPKKELLEKGVPVYGAAGVIGYTSQPTFNMPVLLITCRGSYSGTIHETWEPAFVTNNSMSIVPKTSSINRHYLREALKLADRQSVVTGSAQPQITLTHLNTLRILAAANPVAEAYEMLAGTLWERAAVSNRENGALIALRDALLPKLLSGEIRLKTAEQLVEEIVL